VAALQRQLNFVLSFVGITEQPYSAAGSDDGRVMTITCPSDDYRESDNKASSTTSQRKEPLLCSAANDHSKVSQPEPRRQTTLKESIVTAVYVDKSFKNSRASTFVTG